jgi:hypothetical protein
MRMPDAGGIGRPTVYLLGLVGEPLELELITLKRAKRIAPHAVNKNAMNAPPGKRHNIHLYINRDGATPKLTMSASESS